MSRANGAAHRGVLWAITSYYNPAGYRRRRENYRIFREHLAVPLVTVELGFGGRFELQQGDADILVQLGHGDVMWQKERLLNLALGSLPEECEVVAWIDCDVLFDRAEWSDLALAALERHDLVQLFRHVDYMNPGWAPGNRQAAREPVYRRLGLASAIAEGQRGGEAIRLAGEAGAPRYARGFAWAARREALVAAGFYDECIIGGGDTALVAAALGCTEFILERRMMCDVQQPRYLAWSGRFEGFMAGGVGALDGTIRHLWHGRLEHRRSDSRYSGLIANAFHPGEDLVASCDGPWSWNSAKPALHDYVAAYFVSRAEDD